MKWKLPKLYDTKAHAAHPADEQEIENDLRVVKSVTPKFTLDWYVKWFASILVLVAISFRASNIASLHGLDLMLSCTSCVLWLWVGFVWRDRAIMLVNGVAGIMLFGGTLQYYLT